MSDGSNKSDTPRTDPYAGTWATKFNDRKSIFEHACELERELAAANEGLTVAYMKGFSDAKDESRDSHAKLAEWQAVAGKLAELAGSQIGPNEFHVDCDCFSCEAIKALAEFQKLKEGSE